MDRRTATGRPGTTSTLELRGPAVGDLLRTFLERWDDPHPLDRRNPFRMVMHGWPGCRDTRSRCREQFPAPRRRPGRTPYRSCGRTRTSAPATRSRPRGSAASPAAYLKAFGAPGSLIYLEDQYLWSDADRAADSPTRSQRSPELRVIVVVPRYPDADGRSAGRQLARSVPRRCEMLRRRAPDRVAIYDLENAAGTPDLRARQDLHRRRRLVDLRLRQLQPPLLDL